MNSSGYLNAQSWYNLHITYYILHTTDWLAPTCINKT